MSRVREIKNSGQADSFVKQNKLGVIFFGSARCPHCRNMTSTVEELATKYNLVAFAHVETSEVEVENLDAVPVFLAYKDGEPVDMIVGASPKSLGSMVENLMV